MIDSDSPVTIISHDEIQKILRCGVLIVQSLPQVEKFVDFDNQPVSHIFERRGYIDGTPGEKAIVGTDWLNYLKYAIEPETKDDFRISKKNE